MIKNQFFCICSFPGTANWWRISSVHNYFSSPFLISFNIFSPNHTTTTTTTTTKQKWVQGWRSAAVLWGCCKSSEIYGEWSCQVEWRGITGYSVSFVAIGVGQRGYDLPPVRLPCGARSLCTSAVRCPLPCAALTALILGRLVIILESSQSLNIFISAVAVEYCHKKYVTFITGSSFFVTAVIIRPA